MNFTKTTYKLREAINNALGIFITIEEADVEFHLLDMDSFDFEELVLALKEDFGCELTTQQIQQHNTLIKLTKKVARLNMNFYEKAKEDINYEKRLKPLEQARNSVYKYYAYSKGESTLCDTFEDALAISKNVEKVCINQAEVDAAWKQINELYAELTTLFHKLLLDYAESYYKADKAIAELCLSHALYEHNSVYMVQDDFFKYLSFAQKVLDSKGSHESI